MSTQQGIDVPGDISIIGFDDSVLARGPGIDLTSVQQIPHEMARLAVERIIARTTGDGASDRELVLDPELIVRSTTGSVPDQRGRRSDS
jgi:DNA-binding LacI/PurR family transcriptional regulator